LDFSDLFGKDLDTSDLNESIMDFSDLNDINFNDNYSDKKGDILSVERNKFDDVFSNKYNNEIDEGLQLIKNKIRKNKIKYKLN
jgi:hypothetical protein